MSANGDMTKALTKEDLKRELDSYPSKSDFKRELKRYATKGHLKRAFKNHPTKADLKRALESYATNVELQRKLQAYASKSDLEAWGHVLYDRIEALGDRFSREMAAGFRAMQEWLAGLTKAVDEKYNDLPPRVRRLEDAVFGPKGP